jgi:hypothetical protein
MISALFLLFFSMLSIIMAIAAFLYIRAIHLNLKALRAEIRQNAKNDIEMFNANRKALGLEPL